MIGGTRVPPISANSAERDGAVDLSIIVVSYNVRELLSLCLESLYQTLAESSLAFEVLVVDNASGDGSAAMVRQRFPAARLLANEGNIGYAAASNQGMAACQGRYVLVMNPDTRALGNAIPIMLSFMDERPDVGMVGPALLYGDGGFQHAAFRFPSLLQILIDFFPLHYRLIHSRLNGRYPRRLYEGGEPFAIDHPLGAVMLVRREVIQQVGAMDERFFMYCEEIDWAMRIRQAGWEICTVPQAMFIHYAGQSTQQFRDRMFVALWRSRYLLFQKHYSPAFNWAAKRLVRLGLASQSRRARAAGLDALQLAARLRAYETVRQMPESMPKELG